MGFSGLKDRAKILGKPDPQRLTVLATCLGFYSLSGASSRLDLTCSGSVRYTLSSATLLWLKLSLQRGPETRTILKLN